MGLFFARLDEKRKYLENFDENSIEKLNFIFILENLLLKIEPFGITPFFYSKFVSFGGFPPGYALDSCGNS